MTANGSGGGSGGRLHLTGAQLGLAHLLGVDPEAGLELEVPGTTDVQVVSVDRAPCQHREHQ